MRGIDPDIKRLLVERHGQETADKIEKASQDIASTDRGNMTIEEVIAAMTERKKDKL